MVTIDGPVTIMRLSIGISFHRTRHQAQAARSRSTAPGSLQPVPAGARSLLLPLIVQALRDTRSPQRSPRRPTAAAAADRPLPAGSQGETLPRGPRPSMNIFEAGTLPRDVRSASFAQRTAQFVLDDQGGQGAAEQPVQFAGKPFERPHVLEKTDDQGPGLKLFYILQNDLYSQTGPSSPATLRSFPRPVCRPFSPRCRGCRSQKSRNRRCRTFWRSRSLR